MTREESARLTKIYQRVEVAHNIMLLEEYLSPTTLKLFRVCIAELKAMDRPHPMNERFTPLREKGIVRLAVLLKHYPEEW